MTLKTVDSEVILDGLIPDIVREPAVELGRAIGFGTNQFGRVLDFGDDAFKNQFAFRGNGNTSGVVLALFDKSFQHTDGLRYAFKFALDLSFQQSVLGAGHQIRISYAKTA